MKEIKRTIAIVLSVEEIAQAFAGLNNYDQAHFFNLVGHHFKNFDGLGGDYQCCVIHDADAVLVDDGKWFIETLAQFIEREVEASHD